jgi:copper chaperone CopZ
MKNLIVNLVITAVVLCVGCSNQTNDQSNKKQEQEVNMANLVKTTIKVEGMTCAGCEKSIESNLKEIPGIVDVKANHEDSATFVSFDSTLLSLATIKEGIVQTGYQVHE